MGVRGLWRILEPVKQHKSLADLRGQVIAVDLSIWIVEAKSVLPPSVTKPHLRNLIFRVLHLLQLGIVPVIVVEGVPPDLKQGVMRKRLKHQYRNGPSGELPKKIGRTRFQAVHRECCEVLEMLGVPFVQAASEAEAMCAFLNRLRVVDGCITNDGDAFLYGARTVYRNFTMNAKDRHVDMYSMDDVETTLGLNRESLVGLAVLLGCDYLPKGVAGVGQEMALRFISYLSGESLLQRFNLWKTGGIGSGKGLVSVTEKPVEENICRRALASHGFPYKEVVDEFLVDKDKVPQEQRLIWKRPKLFKIVNYAVDRLEWPEEYTLSKILPLLTLFDMDALICSGIPSSQSLCPYRIVKMRIRQGVSCFEVEWHKIDGDPVTTSEYYTTVEEQEIFRRAFPDIAAAFEDGRKNRAQERKQKTAKKKPSSPEADEICKLTKCFQNVQILEEAKGKEIKQMHRKPFPSCLPGKVPSPHCLPKNVSTDVTETYSEFDHLVRSSLRKSKSMTSINQKSAGKPTKPPRFVISSDSSDDDCYWFDKNLDIHSLQEDNKNAPFAVVSETMSNVVGLVNASTILEKQVLSELDGSPSGDESDSSLECYLPLEQRLALRSQGVNKHKSKPRKGAKDNSGLSGKTRCTTFDDPYQNLQIHATDNLCISRRIKKFGVNDDQKTSKQLMGLPFRSLDRSDSVDRLDRLPVFSVRKSGETESTALKLCPLLNSATEKLCYSHNQKFIENFRNSSSFSEGKIGCVESVDYKLKLHHLCNTGPSWERKTRYSDQNQDKNDHDKSLSEDRLLARANECEKLCWIIPHTPLPNVCPWNVSQYGNFDIETSVLNDIDTSCKLTSQESELYKRTEFDDSQVDLFDCHTFFATPESVDLSNTTPEEVASVGLTSSPTVQSSKGSCNEEVLQCCQKDELRTSSVCTPSVVTVSLAERLRSKFGNGTKMEILAHFAPTMKLSSAKAKNDLM